MIKTSQGQFSIDSKAINVFNEICYGAYPWKVNSTSNINAVDEQDDPLLINSFLDYPLGLPTHYFKIKLI